MLAALCGLTAWCGVGCFVGVARFRYWPLAILGAGYLLWAATFLALARDVAPPGPAFLPGAACIFGFRLAYYRDMRDRGISPRRLFGFGSSYGAATPPPERPPGGGGGLRGLCEVRYSAFVAAAWTGFLANAGYVPAGAVRQAVGWALVLAMAAAAAWVATRRAGADWFRVVWLNTAAATGLATLLWLVVAGAWQLARGQPDVLRPLWGNPVLLAKGGALWVLGVALPVAAVGLGARAAAAAARRRRAAA